MEKIGFIGAGKVGRALASYLQLNGYDHIGFYSDIYPSDLLADKNVQIAETMDDLIRLSDILFITTPDDTIEAIGTLIAQNHDDLSQTLILHCSGALSSQILDPCKAKGALTGTIHPLQAFTGSEQDVVNLTKSYLTIEAALESRPLIQSLIDRLGNPYVWIDPHQKTLYHSAAVIVSNYMVTLLHEGFKIMGTLGIKEDVAFAMMEPLIQSTIGNVKNNGTVDGLTGPILRGDLNVIKSHLQQLDATQPKQSSEFYHLMGQMTFNMIRHTRLDDATYKRLDQFFKE